MWKLICVILICCVFILGVIKVIQMIKNKQNSTYSIVLFSISLITVTTVFLLIVFKDGNFYHERTQAYTSPTQEEINKKIKDMEAKKIKEAVDKSSPYIPKVVYMTYHDIEGIPPMVLENIKKYCKGYTIEIHGDQSCEDFLYEYFGPNAMQLFREIKLGAHKADFWRYCILYAKGGYYFDIKTDFKKHISDIFNNQGKKSWFTVISKREEEIYNGIIGTPPKNPILWSALQVFYTTPQPPNYHYYLARLYSFIQNTCQEPLHPGVNSQNNGWSCTLFKEHCVKGNDRYGLDCVIKNGTDKIFNVRYKDFPWPPSNVKDSIKLLRINPNGEEALKDKNKSEIAIVSSLPWHFECNGFLLDMTRDKYNIHVYSHPDSLGYIDFFHKNYNFKSFLLEFSNLDDKLYKNIIKLTSSDPYVVNDTSKLVHIQHTLEDYDEPTQKAHKTIVLSPLVIRPLITNKTVRVQNAQNITSIFEGENAEHRKNQIIIIGGWKDGPLNEIISNFNYNIIMVRRKPRDIDKKWCKNPHVTCMYSPSTSKLLELIKDSKFIFIHRKEDRFSGAIALALSFHVPMIMDSAQASVYDFPRFEYSKNVSELAPVINNITDCEYKSFLDSLSQYVSEKRKYNWENVDQLLGLDQYREPRLRHPLTEIEAREEQSKYRPRISTIHNEKGKVVGSQNQSPLGIHGVDQIWIINLKGSLRREENMRTQMKKIDPNYLEGKHFRFIRPMNFSAGDITIEKCIEEGLVPSSPDSVDSNLYTVDDDGNKKWNLGTISLSLISYYIYALAHKENKQILVLEDNIKILHDDFKQKLNNWMLSLPNDDWSIIDLHATGLGMGQGTVKLKNSQKFECLSYEKCKEYYESLKNRYDLEETEYRPRIRDTDVYIGCNEGRGAKAFIIKPSTIFFIPSLPVTQPADGMKNHPSGYWNNGIGFVTNINLIGIRGDIPSDRKLIDSGSIQLHPLEEREVENILDTIKEFETIQNSRGRVDGFLYKNNFLPSLYNLNYT